MGLKECALVLLQMINLNTVSHKNKMRMALTRQSEHWKTFTGFLNTEAQSDRSREAAMCNLFKIKGVEILLLKYTEKKSNVFETLGRYVV